MTDSPVVDDTADKMGRKHVRGSALLVVGRVGSIVLTTATQVIIVRALSKEDFGGFAYALVLASGARVLLSLGQGKALSRFMAGYDEEGDFRRMFGAMYLAVATIAVTSVLMIGALFVFSDQLVGSVVNSSEAVRIVLILIFLAPFEALDQVFVALFAVFSKPRAIFFRKYLMAPGLRLVVVLLLIVTNASVTFLAVGYVVASLIGLLLYLGLLAQVLRARGLVKEMDPRRAILPFKAVFSFSLPLITGEFALLSLNVGGVVVLGLYHSIVEIADYRAVYNPARLNTAVTSAFITLFLPLIARLFARNDIGGLRRSYWHTAVFVAVLTFPIFALTGPLAPVTAVTLFGDRYADSAVLLTILSIGYYFNVMLGSNTYTLQVCGRIKFLVGVNVMVMVVNLGLCFLLAPRFAAVGIAVANCTALVLQNLVNQWKLRSNIQTRLIDPSCYLAYGSIVGCALLLWALQVLVEPGLVLSVVAASVASAIVLFASRDAMQLGATFPELTRVPLLRKVIR